MGSQEAVEIVAQSNKAPHLQRSLRFFDNVFSLDCYNRRSEQVRAGAHFRLVVTSLRIGFDCRFVEVVNFGPERRPVGNYQIFGIHLPLQDSSVE